MPVTPEVLDLLRGTHLFGELSPAELAELCGEATIVEVPRGEAVIREGDEGDALYVVLEGALEAAVRRGAEAIPLATMRRGEYFGEIALLERTPRTATVTARTPARVVALERSRLEAFLERHPLIQEALLAGLRTRIAWSRARSRRPPPEALIEALADFFPELDRAALADIEEQVEWLAVPRGAALIRQGDAADGFYLIYSGRVGISMETADGAVELGESGPGEPIGEMALLSNAPRNATVVTRRESELLRFSRAGFDHLVRTHPAALALFLRTMVERMNARARARAVLTRARATPTTTPEECAAVAATPNLVLRNLRITQTYYRLSVELALLLGHADANWCTFACNASKTAGYSIRREELPLYGLWLRLRASRALGPWAARAQGAAASTALARRVDQVLDAVSAAISAGNLKVFAELAPIFARFVAALRDEGRPCPDKLRAITSTLAGGPSELGGQDLLAEALTHYHDATFEADPKRRAELILLGNLKIGLHEQTRLQPNIVQAMNAPLEVGLGGAITAALAPPFLPAGLRRRAEARGLQLTRRLLVRWRRVVTESMMKMRLPYGEMRLGADIRRDRRGRLFADTLGTLEHPELRRLVERFDRTGGALRGSAAGDWGDLDDRMNFILNLFRSRQKSLELFDQPFLSDQRAAIELGVIPEGTL